MEHSIPEVTSTLADLVPANSELHAIVRETSSGAAAASGAIERTRALLQRSAQEPVRDACRRLIDALAGLDACGRSTEDLTRRIRECDAEMARPTTSLDARETLLLRKQLLRSRLSASATSTPAEIPRIVHLVKTDAAAVDLPLVQYLCYRSVLAHSKGYKIVLHAPELPRGPRWSALLPHLEVRPAMPPQFLGSHRLVAAAHQSDVWRLRHLVEHGGFYFDWDLLLLRPPESLRPDACVMALEEREPGYDEVLGVSAIGAQPGSVFLESWLGSMAAAFNPRRYVAHSTVLARRLAIKRLPLVRVLEPRSFYYPGWSEAAMRWLFEPAERLTQQELDERLAGSIGIHLFCSHANFVRRAAGLTERDVESGRCNLATLMRPYL